MSQDFSVQGYSRDQYMIPRGGTTGDLPPCDDGHGTRDVSNWHLVIVLLYLQLLVLSELWPPRLEVQSTSRPVGRREALRMRKRRRKKKDMKERRERRRDKGIIDKKRGEIGRGRKRERKAIELGGLCSLVFLTLLTGTHHERHESWARDLREKQHISTKNTALSIPPLPTQSFYYRGVEEGKERTERRKERMGERGGGKRRKRTRTCYPVSH